MSRTSRLAVVAAAVVVAVVAFLVLRPDDDNNDNAATTPAATSTATTTSASTATTTTTEPAPAPVTTIRVSGGKAVGGVQAITVKEGDQIRFRVVDDKAEHVHLHGYDIEKPVAPGEPASYSVPAKITGVFVIEIEDTGVQIGKLTVEP